MPWRIITLGAGAGFCLSVLANWQAQGQESQPPPADSRRGRAESSQSQASSLENSDSSRTRHSVEANTEALWSSGIVLTDNSAAYRHTRPKWDLNLNLGYSTIDLDYQPADFDIISKSVELGESRVAAQSGLKWKLSPPLSLLGAGGVYDGYANFRTLWLNEYYRQYFSDVRGYKAVEPGGYNFSGGLRWEYMPASGFLQVEGLYSRDDVPSGYEVVVSPPPQIGTELHRSSDRLHTAGARISLENVLTRRIRVLNEFQIADTTDRDPRFSYQGSLNWALAERWVLRSIAGLAFEEPKFHAFSFSGNLEYDWGQKWFVSLFGRYYRDNGEIDNPQLLNVAAPALETFQAGLGLRWQAERWSIRLMAGPYFTRYASVEADVKPFEKLYRGRDWGLAQAALAYSF